MSLKPYVFVPPGAGHRRRVPVVPVKKPGKTVLDAGWLLTKVMAGFLMLLTFLVAAVGVSGAVKTKNPVLVGHGMSKEALDGFTVALPYAGLVAYWVLCALLALYSMAWMVVPLVAMVQGKAWGAILFLLVSPAVLIVAGLAGGLAGWGVGMILGGQVSL